MTRKKNIKTSAMLLSLGLVATAFAEAGSTPLISGVIQSVDTIQKKVVVAGKSISTPDATRVVLGQAVNVYGSLAPDGTILNAVLESTPTYAAGKNPAVADTAAQARAAGISVGGNAAAGISVGGAESQGISVGGHQAEGISVGGAQAQGISVGGVRAEGISVGGTRAEGISVGGIRTEGISVGGRTLD